MQHRFKYRALLFSVYHGDTVAIKELADTPFFISPLAIQDIKNLG